MKKTILLADADEPVRKNLARVLESERYAVVAASNGQQASDLLFSTKPDIALLDLELPHEGDSPGLDALCDTSPSIPIVLITARSHQYKRALQLGVDALMEKPLHLPLLLKTIRNLLREPAAERLQRLIAPDFRTLYLNHNTGLDDSFSENWIQGAPAADSAKKISF